MQLQNQFSEKIYNLALQIVSIIGILLLGFLSISTFFTSFYAEDMESQIMIFHFDPLWIHLPVLAIILALVAVIGKLDDTTLKRIRKFLFLLALLMVGGIGCALILFGRSAPAADAYSVYSIAVAFAQDNLAAIQPTGDTYLSYYPQQIGLIAYYELIIRMLNLLPFTVPAYHVIKLLNILFACGILYFQYRSVAVITKSEKAQVIYLLFAIGNLPLIFYTSFVYGEIPSFAFFSAGLYFLLAYAYHHPKMHYLIISTLALTFSVMLRKNALILIIAVLLATLFHWLKTHKHIWGVYGIIVGILTINILPIVQQTYEHRADNYLLPGVSAYSYFAMGMQESPRGNGWYNGFNFNTYQETGLNNELTDSISKEVISQRLNDFQTDPAYALSFYRDKVLSQWTDGSFACRQAIVSGFFNRSGFFSSLFNGTVGQIFMEYCNIYQFLIYAGVLIYLLKNRKSQELLPYIGIIGIIGGFLFHTIWEANSRYILHYWLLMIPYAAIAFATISKRRIFKKR